MRLLVLVIGLCVALAAAQQGQNHFRVQGHNNNNNQGRINSNTNRGRINGNNQNRGNSNRGQSTVSNSNNQQGSSGGGRLLSLPEVQKCLTRPKQWKFGNHWYYFSWDQEKTNPGEKVDWLEARNRCRSQCMDAVGMETKAENDMIFEFLSSRNLSYIWTSGRLCDFKGCSEREDLKPINVKGWFWSNTNTKMAHTNQFPPGWGYQPWSDKGHFGGPQPDNAEFNINNTTESCLGVLNNIYKDGIKWHDIACYHKKPFVCEDSDALLRFIEQEHGVQL